ncbi:class I SAM-dependent methyltransferase [Roseicitreum antarcticum]|uniref:Methyltransferase domain-containing protein n=1 Tax=Roseicitreum antarcticum TaxID=564137 RepID=A0A1H2X2R4_9RHOB|nr:DUF1698 domain-containing protein [Roseicitreum antarcticum]SDW86784.1 Protein of unknown function [Roseicitreum antarcticum]
MAFFNFLSGREHYDDRAVARMNRRHDFLVTPYAADLQGARVLDIAAHDGRWSYALAGAGATSVHGVEARAETVAQFDDFPDTPFKANVSLTTEDLFDHLDRLVASGATYDVVALYGIMYHVMDHFRILRQVRALQPRLVIIDGEFVRTENPFIHVAYEKTDKSLNAAPQVDGQTTAIVGTPSVGALNRMAQALGFDVAWSPWLTLPDDQRRGVWDYFRNETIRRMTCSLRPTTAADGISVIAGAAAAVALTSATDSAPEPATPTAPPTARPTAPEAGSENARRSKVRLAQRPAAVEPPA